MKVEVDIEVGIADYAYITTKDMEEYVEELNKWLKMMPRFNMVGESKWETTVRARTSLEMTLEADGEYRPREVKKTEIEWVPFLTGQPSDVSVLLWNNVKKLVDIGKWENGNWIVWGEKVFPSLFESTYTYWAYMKEPI